MSEIDIISEGYKYIVCNPLDQAKRISFKNGHNFFFFQVKSLSLSHSLSFSLNGLLDVPVSTHFGVTQRGIEAPSILWW